MADIVEDVVSGLIEKGVEKIATRKSLTSQDLTVLLLHQQGKSIARLEKGMDGIATELRGFREEFRQELRDFREEFRQDLVPLLDQSKDIADIKARVERIEDRLSGR